MNGTCDDCELHQAMHKVGDREQCCGCYVSDGNPPADWHKVCMETYDRICERERHGAAPEQGEKK